MMTSFQFLRLLAFSLLIAFCSFAKAQQMEMHSTSPKAVQLMNEALENMGHDMEIFNDNVTQALKLDPSMVAANFFKGIDPEKKKEEVRPYIERIQAYKGELSAGEKHLVEMASHFDDEEYQVVDNMAKLTEIYPNDAKLNLFAGVAYMFTQKPDKAMPYLEKAGQIGNLPGTHNMLGYAYLRQGSMEKAQEHFAAYLEAAPDHHNPYDSMGDFLMVMKDYENAATHFDKAAKMNPDQPLHAEKAKKAREMMDK
jgi:tetratricopeptide (TPR) repeat protein